MSSKIKNLKCYERMEITMAEFLYLYCGKSDQRFFKVTHDDVKVLMPHLKRTSFDHALSNSNLIYTGDIILVRDCRKNIAPYISPFRKETLEIIEINDELIKEETHIEKEEYNIKELSNYKFKTIFKLERKSNFSGKYKICRVIKKEIDDRGLKGPRRKRKLVEEIRRKEND